MKTFIADIIPKIQRFSQKLDNLTLLTNQHWVVFDDFNSAKNVYIFRLNNQLLISKNGKVNKGRWENIGNNSLLIDLEKESFLFKHGFFDQNILALKLDGKNEYVFLINENKYRGELNSYDKIIDFLISNYLNKPIPDGIENKMTIQKPKVNNVQSQRTKPYVERKLLDGRIMEIYSNQRIGYEVGDRVTINGEIPENGKYSFGWLDTIEIANGKIRRLQLMVRWFHRY